MGRGEGEGGYIILPFDGTKRNVAKVVSNA